MIQLDENYKLQNNNVHGVELVFEEIRTKDEKERLHSEKWYYPNPVLAIKKWIELTSANVKNLDELIEITNQINQKLEIIKNEFINNKRKL